MGVTVIGSACTPPGFVMVECDPIEPFRRDDEMHSVMPVRFRIGNLWGMHLRVDQWWHAGLSGSGGDDALHDNAPPMPGGRGAYEKIPSAMMEQYPRWAPHGAVKGHYREHPLAGMSCAIFEVPASRRIRITGGSELPGWTEDNYPNDNHYSFRIIRTVVMREA